jgi:XTP/dITP diphosphohydrolase
MITRHELLIATRNTGKVIEINQLLSDLPIATRSLAEFPWAGEVEETGTSFEENATLKARFFADATGLPTLADDSGLEVEALGGAPGIYSARYAGPDATDADRIELLLRELSKASDVTRRAQFVCALALIHPEGETVRLFRGTCVGRLASEPSGAGGFGYDPIFIPEGYTLTFGELPSDVKNRVSHRARALNSLKEYLSSTTSKT